MATYSDIKANLIAVIEATAPPNTESGMPPRFKHQPMMDPDDAARSRDFSLTSSRGSTRSSDPAGARRTFREFDLAIGYAPRVDVNALDDVTGDDYRAIRDALMDSTALHADIFSLGEGAEEMFDCSIEQEENGIFMLITFVCEYVSS